MGRSPSGLGEDFVDRPGEGATEIFEKTDRQEVPKGTWQDRTDPLVDLDAEELTDAPEPEVLPVTRALDSPLAVVSEQRTDPAHDAIADALATAPLPEIEEPLDVEPLEDEPQPASVIGSLVANRYQIEREIASGGMGRVYLATQLPLGRPVAVKMVRTEISGSRQQFLKRFFLEASACAKLTHPNIITIHDYGESETGDVFMAMEFLDGRSLDKEIKNTAPMAQERALHIGIQICRALREAHGKGIIHRDLKPQNVMLVSSGDEQDFVKVLDFGLVKMLGVGEGGPEQELTRAGVLLGSPNYMSPEQILGGTLDPRTDIYSFGVVLYKMLTGKNPYARDAEVDVIYKHVYHPIPSLADAGVECTPEVDALVQRCLAKTQAERFDNCKELIIALKDARRGALGGGSKKRRKRREEDLEAADPLELPPPEQPVLVPPPPPPVEPQRDAAAAEASAGAASQPSASVLSQSSRSGTMFRARPSSIPATSAIARAFLRSKSGEVVGPIPLRQLEVLYHAHVIDELTPVSSDGVSFARVQDNAELLQRLLSVKQRLMNGEDPWNKTTVSVPPTSGASPLKTLLDCAVNEANGYLTFRRGNEEIRFSYSGGRIAEVRARARGLGLAELLIQRGVFTRAQLDERLPIAPERSGDLGDALIAAGLVPPHTFLERVVEWVKHVLGAVMAFEPGSGTFEEAEVALPQLPLGLDRFSVLTEAMRGGVAKEAIDRAFADKQNLLVIPSTPNGATIDQFKLAPKELRVLRSADSSKTLRELIAAAPKDQRESVTKTLWFATETGMLAWGGDQILPKERADAQRLQQLYAKLKEKTAFDVLGVTDSSNDDEVRSRYMELCKTYHTDNVRPNAAPELLDAMRALFTLVQDAYEALETEEKREKFKQLRELGYDGQAFSEEDVVRRVLEAEVLFKKAKTLIKMSKYDDAIATMKEAVARKPRDIELKVHLRYFEFLPNKSDRAAEAARAIVDITKLIRNEEHEIAAAYLFLGRLHKIVGREDLAVKYFKKVLKFDPRNHEAESEIRLANLRETKKKKSLLGRLSGAGED